MAPKRSAQELQPKRAAAKGKAPAAAEPSSSGSEVQCDGSLVPGCSARPPDACAALRARSRLRAQDLVSHSGDSGSSVSEDDGAEHDDADDDDEDHDDDDAPQAPAPDDGEGSDFDELQARRHAR
jgi:hypothetical protein